MNQSETMAVAEAREALVSKFIFEMGHRAACPAHMDRVRNVGPCDCGAETEANELADAFEAAIRASERGAGCAYCEHDERHPIHGPDAWVENLPRNHPFKARESPTQDALREALEAFMDDADALWRDWSEHDWYWAPETWKRAKAALAGARALHPEPDLREPVDESRPSGAALDGVASAGQALQDQQPSLVQEGRESPTQD